LESVFEQKYQDWECLIIDDGSTDGTAAIAEEWIKKGTRFIYFKQENAGVSAARNFGLSKAKGEWIQFLDADDYLAPSKLSKSLQVCENLKTVNFIATNFRHFTTDVNRTTPPFCNLQKEYLTFEKMLYEWNSTFSLPPHTILLKKELIGDTLFPVDLTAQEDWFFWVAIFKKHCVPCFINEPLALYRSHSNSRIKSRGITEDQLRVYNLFSHVLTQQEHNKLSQVLIARYLKRNVLLSNLIREAKNSNSFQTGMMIKKVLRFFGVLEPGRKLFQYMKVFKKSKI